VKYHISSFEFCIVLNPLELGSCDMFIELDFGVLLLVFDQVETGYIVLDLDLA
jgi:hypothetical protein